ncbi:hypothetical protein PENTCL1PPCAC_18519 [Pristionchus entomophagus]|uniref:BTB domain-containing protein n=1 Tax=Pristionchus entomophagus TaxID=358040 RepID=A0AAV5TPN7_9BILA|nr:hypothetical protein PENTCL1PPCAC_18519 [Pristionchus entomophagus]
MTDGPLRGYTLKRDRPFANNNFSTLFDQAQRMYPTEIVLAVETECESFARHPILDPKSSIHDVILVMEGQRIPVNKQVLSSQSSYFMALFYSNFKESKQDEIEIKDVDPEDFDELLKMMYRVSTEPTTDGERSNGELPSLHSSYLHSSQDSHRSRSQSEILLLYEDKANLVSLKDSPEFELSDSMKYELSDSKYELSDSMKNILFENARELLDSVDSSVVHVIVSFFLFVTVNLLHR